MSTLINPPKRYINILHPYTQFTLDYNKIINSANTIYKEIFNFIHRTLEPIDIHILREKFSFLPNSLLNETLRIYEPLNEYSHPLPIPNRNQNNTNNTQIISWNASSLNTALPNLQDIIQHTNLAIIAIQETKLTTTTSTKYIQFLFSQYKPISITHMH